jgi:CheY-like chemotaxis protein
MGRSVQVNHHVGNNSHVPSAERPPLILLVDDNEEHRTIYAMVLEAAGFQVVEAADGTSAVGKARTMRPDVILLDCTCRA